MASFGNNVQTTDVASGTITPETSIFALRHNYGGSTCPTAEHHYSHTRAEIENIVGIAVEKLQDCRDEMTVIFQQYPVDLTAVADLVEVAQKVHSRAAARVRGRFHDRERCYFAHRREELNAISARHPKYLPFIMHKWVFDFLSGSPLHKFNLARSHNSRMWALDEALDKVIKHQRIVLLDEGNCMTC